MSACMSSDQRSPATMHASRRRLATTLSHLTRPRHTTAYTATSSVRMMSTAAQTVTDAEVLSKEYSTSGLGHIHLNRPKALNSLNITMVEQVLKALETWSKSTSIKALLITGEGRALCAGGDIRSLAFPPHEQWAEQFFRLEYIMNYQLATYAKPIVAIQHGVTMGGGVGISVHGKYRVATDDTVLAMPETGIGLFTDVGATYFLPRLRGANGMFMAMTGYRCNGSDLIYLQIATHYVAKSKIASLVETLQNTKYSDLADTLQQFSSQPSEPSKLEAQQSYITKSFSTFNVEEVFSNLEKQSQSSDSKEAEWAQAQLKALNTKSRTSMEVTAEGLKRGKGLSLAECLKQEYRMGVRTARAKGDFQEGVRALIVDKDNKPKWRPQPSKQEVLAYFADFNKDDESNVSDLQFPKQNVQGI